MADRPAGVVADGMLKVLWVPTIANPGAPTVTELTAAGVVDLSCYLTSDGYTTGGDEQVITDDRLCDTDTYERPGRSTNTLDVIYVYDQQDVMASNEAFTTLKHLTEGHIVSRWGKDFDTAIAAADVVDVMPAQAGKQRKQTPEANSMLKIGQKLFITGPVNEDVAVAAGP